MVYSRNSKKGDFKKRQECLRTIFGGGGAWIQPATGGMSWRSISVCRQRDYRTKWGINTAQYWESEQTSLTWTDVVCWWSVENKVQLAVEALEN